MTGVAYRRSAELAGVVGPYDGYARNADAHKRVIRKHAAANDYVRSTGGNDGAVLKLATSVWQDTVATGERNGYRNAQASVLAPTGCLTGDTLVSTDRGLLRLSELGDVYGDKWQDLGIEVSTDEGPQVATKFFVIATGFDRKASHYRHRRVATPVDMTRYQEYAQRVMAAANGGPVPLEPMEAPPQPVSRRPTIEVPLRNADAGAKAVRAGAGGGNAEVQDQSALRRPRVLAPYIRGRHVRGGRLQAAHRPAKAGPPADPGRVDSIGESVAAA